MREIWQCEDSCLLSDRTVTIVPLVASKIRALYLHCGSTLLIWRQRPQQHQSKNGNSRPIEIGWVASQRTRSKGHECAAPAERNMGCLFAFWTTVSKESFCKPPLSLHLLCGGCFLSIRLLFCLISFVKNSAMPSSLTALYPGSQFIVIRRWILLYALNWCLT